MPSSASSPVSLPPMALVAALAAALVGALVWAGIAYVTEFEIGYVAWGIGLLVGFAAVRLGACGRPVAVLAAALTLGSILGGKLLAQEMFIEQAISEAMDPSVARPMYEEHLVDARGWAEMFDTSDDGEVREYMVAHRFTEAQDASEVHPAELADFRRFAVPMLERSTLSEPTFDEWRKRSTANAWAQVEEVSRLGAVVEGLGPIDLIFAILGLATAWGMVARASAPTPGTETATATAPPSSASDEHRRAA